MDDTINFFADVNTTKGKIISAACEILKNENYQGMTTSEISKAASIAEGTIYRYFSSKREILLSILDELNNYLVKTFFSGIDYSASVYEKLMAIGKNFFIHKDQLASLYSIIFKVFSEVSDSDIKEKFKIIYDKILNQITFLLSNNKVNDGKNEDKIILATYFLWGAGELLWKLDIVNDGKILNDKLIYKMLNIISNIIGIEEGQNEKFK